MVKYTVETAGIEGGGPPPGTYWVGAKKRKTRSSGKREKIAE